MPIRKASGWHRQKEDLRDLSFGAGLSKALAIPDVIMLDRPDRYDQGNTSSCTGNAGARVFQMGLKKAGYGDWTPSRLQLYFDARREEGSTGSDSGANIRDIFRGAHDYGFAPETFWAFDESKVTTQPSDYVYQQSAKYKIHNYANFDGGNLIDRLRLCLSHEYPIELGIDVPAFIQTEVFSKNPILKLSDAIHDWNGEGHAICITGVKHTDRLFRWDNSWGMDWGEEGSGYIDYDFIISMYASDFWMCRFLPFGSPIV